MNSQYPRDLEGYGGLHLTEACRPVLRGEQPLMLRKLATRSATAKRDRKASQFADKADKALWQALREKRQQLAGEQSVPAYVIFHDATLLEMAAGRPHAEEHDADGEVREVVEELEREDAGVADLQQDGRHGHEKDLEPECPVDCGGVQSRTGRATFHAGADGSRIPRSV